MTQLYVLYQPPPPYQTITVQAAPGKPSFAEQEEARQKALLNPQYPTSPRFASASRADQTSIDQLLSKLLAMGGGCDQAFIVFALQIQSTNKLISEQIRGVQQIAKLREAVAGTLDQIRTLKAAAANDKDNKITSKEAAKAIGSEGPVDDLKPGTNPDLPYTQVNWGLDPATGQPVSREGDPLFEQKSIMHLGEEKKFPVTFTKERLEAEEARLQAQLEKIDSDRELAMITLNANINRKGQFVEWLSNMMKRTGDTQSSVISNLR